MKTLEKKLKSNQTLELATKEGSNKTLAFCKLTDFYAVSDEGSIFQIITHSDLQNLKESKEMVLDCEYIAESCVYHNAEDYVSELLNRGEFTEEDFLLCKKCAERFWLFNFDKTQYFMSEFEDIDGDNEDILYERAIKNLITDVVNIDTIDDNVVDTINLEKSYYGTFLFYLDNDVNSQENFKELYSKIRVENLEADFYITVYNIDCCNNQIETKYFFKSKDIEEIWDDRDLEFYKKIIIKKTVELFSTCFDGDGNRTFYVKLDERRQIDVDYLFYLGQIAEDSTCFYTIYKNEIPTPEELGAEKYEDADFSSYEDDIERAIEQLIVSRI